MAFKYSQYAIILGAGASHGAAVGLPAPPLDLDFLKEAESCLGKTRWKALCASLKKAGISRTGIPNYRLEELATYLEARANMPSLQAHAGSPADYGKALAQLKQAICWILLTTNGTKHCELHKALFDVVRPECIVNFNYDLIADQTLALLNRLSWTKKSYAGSSLYIHASGSKAYTRSKPNRKLQGAVHYYKLHGSINWQKHERGPGYSLCLSQMPGQKACLPYTVPPVDPMVVPPVAAKMDIANGAVRKLWSSASRGLRSAPGWIIWGYSFPATDTITQVLCRTALANNHNPKPVVVIDPDFSVSSRIKKLLQKVRVKNQWGSVERFLYDARKLKI